LEEAVTDGLTLLMKHLLITRGRDFFREMEKTGLSITQAKTLMLLIETDEPMPLRALSDVTGLSVPGISRAVDGLVQRGELNREEDPRDRRSKLLTVTARGRKTYERLLSTRVAGVRRFVDELTREEQEVLARGLEAVARRIER